MPEFATPIAPDPPDERDLMYVPEHEPGYVRPVAVDHEEYRRLVGTTWHQRGEECTGFALAAIANYHRRRRHDDPTLPSVSRRMMYEMAQMYDDEAWEEGSTLRGALKGWSRTGVALDELWPYDPRDEDGSRHGTLTLARLLDARRRPLLSYRKIEGTDVGAMQDALAAGYPLYVSARLHVGWYRLFLPDIEPTIARRPDDADKGGHAFVIAGYDELGFWVHNSWGPEWGVEGCALMPYDEWRTAHQDVWVVDVAPDEPTRTAPTPAAPSSVQSYRKLWQHLVVLDDDGRLASRGLYEMDEASLATLLFLFQEHTADWPRRRVAIVADGAVLPTATAIEQFCDLRDRLLAAGIYPFFVVWETSWLNELHDELDTWSARLGDDTPIEAVIDRSAAGLIWHQIKRRSTAACADPSGGARILAERIRYKRNQKPFDLHLLSHGAGDLLMTQLAHLLRGELTTATAVVPATPLADFAGSYARLLDAGRLQQLSLIVDDATVSHEPDPLPMPLLQLVSRLHADVGESAASDARGARRSILGIATDVDDDPTLTRLRTTGRVEVRTASGPHAGLLADRDLTNGFIDEMLRHETQAPMPTPAADAGDGALALPDDPLARAEALRAQARTTARA